METLNYDKSCWAKQCPKVDCKKKECCCGLKYVNVPAALGDDGKNSSVAPVVGRYSNAVVEYEANGHIWVYTNEGVPVEVEKDHSGGSPYFDDLIGRPRYAGFKMTSGTNIPEVPDAVSELNNDLGFQTADDVASMISGKQDTLTAGDNITISENGQNQLVISAEDTTYTAGSGLELNNNEFSVDTDTIQPKLTAGANIAINSSNEISATDTTYSGFTGATSGEAGEQGLVPAPASGETNKYLKSDGTWDVPTDTTYINFVGTDGVDAGSAGLVPAPDATDTGKFLKSDGTWETAGGVTIEQGNTLATSAPTTATAGVLGQLYTDTTGMHTYQLTSIDTTDPDNPSYTWTQRW